MSLSTALQKMFLLEDDIVGLVLYDDNPAAPKIFWFKVQGFEDANLKNFLIGTALAQGATGTGYSEIQDAANNNRLLEPTLENRINHFFWGAYPTRAQIFRQYPPGVDRGALQDNRDEGGLIGFIDGADSPMDFPSIQTETWSMKGLFPAYLGYHPDPFPASIAVYMSFYARTYLVKAVSPQEVGELLRQDQRVRVVRPGGRYPSPAPDWIRSRVPADWRVPALT